MKSIHKWALAAAALAGAAAGCGGAVHRVDEAGVLRVVADAVPLQVRNNNAADMDIFVLIGGTWKRIGFVAGGSSADFELGALDWTGAPLRVLAIPVGGRGAARSDPLTVFPGHIVTFTIGADLARSSAIVR